MKQPYLEAGKIVATHGVHGELKLLPWADSPEFLQPFATFYLEGRPLTVQRSRVQKTCLLLKFKGIDTVEAAAALQNKVLCISRQDPAVPPGTVFIADLIGLPVTAAGKTIGKITQVLSMPSSNVYVVKGEHEYMIPAVPAFVSPLSPDMDHLEVNLIEGMRTDAD